MILDSGEHEGLKSVIHGILGTLVVICFGYNAAAFVKRRETHLGVGALIYLALSCWEVGKTTRHIKEARKDRVG